MHSLIYRRWSCELEFRGKLEICKIQILEFTFFDRDFLDEVTIEIEFYVVSYEFLQNRFEKIMKYEAN
jgi:hypothetical protein